MPTAIATGSQKRCDEAGLQGSSSHSVRKAFAELLAEEGCSEHQIMAVLSRAAKQVCNLNQWGRTPRNARRRHALDSWLFLVMWTTRNSNAVHH